MLFFSKVIVQQWVRLGLLNLFLVAVLGLLMRIKFIVALPIINQKFVLHAHSHFAFTGWVSHLLMLFMVVAVFQLGARDRLPKRYGLLIFLNLLCAYGMLISFFLQGYGAISIMFSTSSILVSYAFAWSMWQSLFRQKLERSIARWFYAALVFLVFSSLGTFYLAFLMATHNVEIKHQLAAIYFYLHFQYNGWFFFAIMGLAYVYFTHIKLAIPKRAQDLSFVMLTVLVVPLYFLSMLWGSTPTLLYWTLVIGALLQCFIWVYWMWQLNLGSRSLHVSIRHSFINKLLTLVCWAVLLKFLLQALSVIPALSHFVYGYRPVVIGYLHLVLLLIVSLFLLAYLFGNEYLKMSTYQKNGLILFLTGILLNELALALQAFFAWMGSGLHHAHYYLLFAAICMVLGAMGMLLRQIIKSN